MSGSKGGRVIDAIAGHHHNLALLTELLDALMFVLRLNPSLHLINSELFGHRIRSSFVVAGKHDNFEAQFVKLSQGFGRRCLDGVRDSEYSRQLTADGHVHGCLSFRLQGCRLELHHSQIRDSSVLEKFEFSNHNFPTLGFSNHAATCDRGKIGHVLKFDSTLGCGSDNSARKGMFAVFLDRCGGGE